MLEIRSLSYSYPKAAKPVFFDLGLELQSGNIYGLLGSNGAGKSTLLYLMCGLLRPQYGQVRFNGHDVCLRQPDTLADIFLVSEEFELPPVRLDEFIRINSQFYPRFDRAAMEKYLTDFRLDTHLHLGRLSMGQKKKVFIAFALACNTSLLLMDEPTNGLDIPGKSEFRRALISAMNENRTVVISTHQVRDLDRVLDHVTIVDGGRLLLNSSISALQQCLAFSLENAPDPTALYSQPTAGGYSIVRPADEGAEETDVNLESLFEMIVTQRQNIF